MKFNVVWGLLKETFEEWNKDKVSRLAAALAYYTIFSLAPLLIIAIAIAGAVFGSSAVRGEIVGQLQGIIGKPGADLIQTAIINASVPKQGNIASIVSVLVLLFGASGLFAQLQDALNTIWGVQPKPGRGIIPVVRDRFFSFAMVFGVGFLLIVLLVASTILKTASIYFHNFLPGAGFVWQIVNFVFSFGVTTLLFGLIFKLLPDVKIVWSDVWIGATLTSVLFSIGSFVLGKYLGSSSFGSIYGAAGTLVVILAWIYYAAQILFIGAEFTQVYARKYGSQIVPADNAIPVTEEARAQQGMNNAQQRMNNNKRPTGNLFGRLWRGLTQSKRSRRNKSR
jgi:membrane protein